MRNNMRSYDSRRHMELLIGVRTETRESHNIYHDNLRHHSTFLWVGKVAIDEAKPVLMISKRSHYKLPSHYTHELNCNASSFHFYFLFQKYSRVTPNENLFYK